MRQIFLTLWCKIKDWWFWSFQVLNCDHSISTLHQSLLCFCEIVNLGMFIIKSTITVSSILWTNKQSSYKITVFFPVLLCIPPSCQCIYKHWHTHMAARSYAPLPAMRTVAGFDPRLATFFRWDWSWNHFYDHSLPLIQEGQLSVTCERMCTWY